ncbi:FAD-binding protein [Caulobacter sp. Root342]|jgi:3-oxosteroid 1-dehydrogenase|uniref:FAD-binding protein n=1 Tax=Caulobacter sp. Root342 TaxID=1736519 RepID=UPI0009E8B378|nr:FAD-binding protein [Caulobacter sp. Root342]
MESRAVEDCDVLVVGSGAGALTAAARAHDQGFSVSIIEKAPLWGGTSAISGGALWVANSGRLGDRDSREKALAYLRACTEGEVPEARLEAYVDQAPLALDYLEKIGVRLEANPEYPDYRQDLPGALPAGRTIDPQPYDGAKLGEHFFTLRDQLSFMKVLGRISLSNTEGRALSKRRKGWMTLLMRMMAEYWLDFGWRAKTTRGRRLTMGLSLVAPLGQAVFDRKIPLHLGARLLSLTKHPDGGFVATVSRGDIQVEVRARKGVVLGAGGFEHNAELRALHLAPGATTDHSSTPKGQNVGDGLKAGEAIGAATEAMGNAWWAPAMYGPMGDDPDAVYVLFMERAFPGGVVLNAHGRRFGNEAQSYNDFGALMIDQAKVTGTSDCWLFFDAGFRKRYMVGPMMAGALTPDHKLPADWLGKVYHRADSLAALASQIGLDPGAVESSIARFNEQADKGVDADFGRGGDIYDHYFGDETFPNPNLAPLRQSPFYAVRIVLGDLGTKGGLKVDVNANVLDVNGAPIDGLYAIGNTASSMMGRSYPGAGGTLGPAVTFGFAAANHLARGRNTPALPAAQTLDA